MADIIKEKLELNITIGIGKACSGVESLSKSYKEALISQRYNDIDINIKHYEDIIFIPGFNEKSQGNQRDVLLEYDLSIADKKSNSKHADLLIKAKEFILKNYNKDITLEEVAHHVGISPYYFSKIFRASAGKNYMDYVTDLRIEKAKDMLKSGLESIKEICYEVGYNDPNYFSRVFKKIEGVTPSDYKFRLWG